MKTLVLFHAIYFAVTLYCVVHAISCLFMDKKTNWSKFGKRIVMSLIWPITIFSPSGRKLIFKHTKDF